MTNNFNHSPFISENTNYIEWPESEDQKRPLLVYYGEKRAVRKAKKIIRKYPSECRIITEVKDGILAEFTYKRLVKGIDYNYLPKKGMNVIRQLCE